MSISDSVEIRIATQYDGTGAKQAIDDQARVAESTERTAQAGSGGAGGGDAAAQGVKAREAAFDSYAAKVAAADGTEMAAHQKKAVALEQELITATRRAQIEAAIGGDKTEISKLQSELAARQWTLRTLQQTAMTEKEIVALVAEEDALMRAGAAAAEARAAATEAEAAGRIHGRAGHLGHLLENFGAGANLAISVGMGAMFGMEAYRGIKEYAEGLEKVNEANAKAGEQASELIQKTRERLGAARNLTDVAKIEVDLTQKLEEARKGAAQAEGDEQARLNLQITALEASVRLVERNYQSSLARKTPEEEVKGEIEAQNAALKEQLEAQEGIRHEIEFRLKLEQAEADAVLRNQLMTIKAQEDHGEISHEEAAKQETQAQQAAADAKNKREVEAKLKEARSLEADAARLQADKEQKGATATQAQAKADQAQIDLKASQAANQQRGGATRAEADAEAAEARLQSLNATPAQNPIMAQAIVEAKAAAEAKRRTADAEAAKATAMEAAAPKNKTEAELAKEAEAAANAAEIAQKAKADAEKEAGQIAKKNQEAKDKRTEAAAQQKRYEIDSRTQTTESGLKVEHGQQADQRAAQARQREAERAAQERQREEERQRKEFDKAGGGAAVAGVQGAAGAANSIVSKGWQGQGEKLIQALARKVQQHPQDHQLSDRLFTAMEAYIKSRGVFDQAQASQMKAAEARFKQFESELERAERQMREARSY